MFHSSQLIGNPSIESFDHLWELIRDVAVHDFQFLPEETKSVCDLMQVDITPFTVQLTSFTVG